MCEFGEAIDAKCNTRSYDPATYNSTSVDGTAKMIKCDYEQGLGKCKYSNSVDGTVSTQPCTCALNKEGTSWCPVAPGNGI